MGYGSKKLAKSANGIKLINFFLMMSSPDVSLVDNLESGPESRRSGSNFRERKRDVSSITFAD